MPAENKAVVLVSNGIQKIKPMNVQTSNTIIDTTNLIIDTHISIIAFTPNMYVGTASYPNRAKVSKVIRARRNGTHGCSLRPSGKCRLGAKRAGRSGSKHRTRREKLDPYLTQDRVGHWLG